jgi:hypothetical protein
MPRWSEVDMAPNDCYEGLCSPVSSLQLLYENSTNPSLPSPHMPKKLQINMSSSFETP